MSRIRFAIVGLTTACVLAAARAAEVEGSGTAAGSLPGTRLLTLEGDIASELVAGVDRFLLREMERTARERPQRDASVEPLRKRLARILGVRDSRIAPPALSLDATTGESSVVGRGTGYVIHAVSWSAFGDVTAEGLLLEPECAKPVAGIVAVPDADVSPEMLCGLVDGVPLASQFARRLAECGCRVVVPVLIDRGVAHRQLSSREFLYRSAFELGRHIIGYEVQKILAAVDWLSAVGGPDPRIGAMGWGEGGLLVLHAAALDPRISAACVSGYFEPRESVWEEPVYRNLFGILVDFGDAELARMVASRPLIIEASRGPEVVVPPGTGGAPGRLRTPPLDRVRAEVERARGLTAGSGASARIELVVSGGGDAGAAGSGPFGSAAALEAFLGGLGVEATAGDSGRPPEVARSPVDAAARQRRQFHEIDRHNQQLLAESPYERREFFSRLDTSSLDRFQATVESYRQYFRDEVIGRFPGDLLPPDPRSRKFTDQPGYEGHEVVLDVFPDVIAYGILLVPRGMAPGERRPVVVCQHGLEGRPRDVADPAVENPSYHRFACQLAERGFVTFSPQNLYIFGDRFRTLQRKANPLGKTLFSVIVPQHEQIVRWLGTLSFVDPARIAFYGLSYGGKTAMRVPPLVSGYCLSICSADFNDWVWKNASSRSPYSYVWTGEYEIFEFDLGSTFNYAEMAALIAPRPFMVERGHFDGVAPDEAVAYEFAKVRFLYDARLGIGDRARIEFFVGPHTIHGKGTFDFLHEHLRWPRPDVR